MDFVKKNGAMRTILRSVERAERAEKVARFEEHGPRVKFAGGTYVARGCGLSASCTVDAVSAVIAWARKAREFLENEDGRSNG